MLDFPVTLALPIGEQLVMGMVTKLDKLLATQNCIVQTVGGQMPVLRFNASADLLIGSLKSDVLNLMDAKMEGHDIPMSLFKQNDYQLEFEKFPGDYTGSMMRVNLLVYTPVGRLTLEIL